MKKIYRKLTKDQKERGVIFSSQLLPGGTLHEVTATNLYDCSPGTNKIDLLKDDKFFRNSCYKFNELRQ
jgi:hypothetical protein